MEASKAKLLSRLDIRQACGEVTGESSPCRKGTNVNVDARDTALRDNSWRLLHRICPVYLRCTVTSLLAEGSMVQNSARLSAALPRVVRLPLMSLEVAD